MSIEKAVERVNRFPTVQARWVEAEVLLIDERRPFLFLSAFSLVTS